MTIEVDGMLWQPRPEATAPAEEFIRARSLIMDILASAQWNPWVREDRGGEFDAAVTVFEQWTRAEPSFQRKTDAEFQAEQEEWWASLDGRVKAETAWRDQEHAKRAAGHDPERAQVRLALVEQQAVLARTVRERDGAEQDTVISDYDTVIGRVRVLFLRELPDLLT